MTIPSDEYPALLKRAYDNEKFDKPRNVLGVTRDLPPAEMKKLMLANITVAPDELRELGERRASVAKNAPQKLGVSGERMFIVAAADASGSGADEKRAPRVDFVLK